MAGQIVFPVVLYAVGLLPGFFLHRRVPLAVFAWTGFAWGALAWALASALLLILPVEYSIARVALVVGLLGMAALVLFYRRIGVVPRREWRQAVPGAAVFAGVVCGAAALSLVKTSSDSFYQIFLANEWAANRLDELALMEFGYWGIVLVSLQAAAPALGADYFYTIAPATGITLLGAFGYLCLAGLRRLEHRVERPELVAGLATLYLASSFLVAFQFVYIHNNSIAAMYLLIAVGTLWLSHVESSRGYFWLSMLAFLAFGMARTETALYVVVSLIPALSLRRFSRRLWMAALLPYTAHLTIWNMWLLAFVRPDTHIMSPERLLVMIAAITGVYAMAFFAGTAALRDRVTPQLHRIMFLFLAMVLVIVVLLEPLHVPITAGTFFLNLIGLGFLWWGFVWWVVGALVVFAVPRTRALPFEVLFVTGIAGFVLVLTIVSYAHPFRVSPWDSGNRAFLYILPVVWLYLTLKVGPYLLPARPLAAEGRIASGAVANADHE